jgi:hypothetical protein
MKRLNKNLFIGLFVSLTSLQLYATDEFTKKISKSFEVNKDATLSVKNKFGKVQCENWDKNTISIDVTITLHTTSQEKANKYFEQVNVEITGNSTYVSAVTDLDGDIFGRNNCDLTIDYMIMIPRTINVELSNKFGEIIFAETSGSAAIDLGYGSLNVKRLTGENNKIEMQFSDGSTIGFMKSATIDLKYSELDIDEAVSLNGESKFTELNIGKVDVLTLETGYDDDFIETVRSMDIEADFSDIEVRQLTESMTVNFDYGGLKVKEVTRNFKLVDISSSFSDANIGFNPEASFRLSAMVKMGDLSYPSENARISVTELSYTSNKYEGLVGMNSETGSKVLINSENSGVTLFYR